MHLRTIRIQNIGKSLCSYTIRAKYELAVVSVEEKLQGRYREVVDEYYNYMNEYPEGKYVKQVQKFYDYASKRITDTY